MALSEKELAQEMKEEEERKTEELEDQTLDLGEEQIRNQELFGLKDTDKKDQYDLILQTTSDKKNMSRQANLSIEELGRPLFSVRTLLALKQISIHYLNPFVIKFTTDILNEIEDLKSDLDLEISKFDYSLSNEEDLEKQNSILKEKEAFIR
ncbi:hypothetical protein LCGC14_3034210, partial [marine sediment metagenome]